MIWFKYQAHDYMDEAPHIGYHLFSSRESALKWEKYMNENYSRGTTTIIGEATMQEVLDYANGLPLDSVTLARINDPSNYAKL